MIEIPKVWGRHNEAVIDAVLVHEKSFVTSIMNPPTAWEGRLESLGFKRATKAWLKIGPLTPSEFQFLSPSIDLVGLRPEEVIDYEQPDSEGTPVPYAVQDAILKLWQRQSAAMLVALSMEHGIHYSRQEAWTFVETALGGAVTPETETVIGLALTRLALDGELDDGVAIYAAQIGWERAGPAERIERGALLHRAGETVSWVDRDGETLTGRLAQRLMSEDKGAWVHKEHPRWVGGYPVVAPEWVERGRFVFENAVTVSEQRDEEELRSQPLQIPEISYLSERQLKAISEICSYRGPFPCDGWKDGLADDFPEAALAGLVELESVLKQMSAHYYGNLPLAFGITDVYQVNDATLSVFVVSDDGTGFGRAIKETGLQFGEGVNLSSVASKLDASLRKSMAVIEEHAKLIGEALGAGVEVLPARLFYEDSRAWSKVPAVTGDKLGKQDLYKLVAATVAQYDLIGRLSSNERPQPVSDALEFDVILEPRFGMDSARLVANKFDFETYPVTAVLSSFDRAREEGSPFLAGVQTQSSILYTADVIHPGDTILSNSMVDGVNYKLHRNRMKDDPHARLIRAVHGDTSSLFKAFKELLAKIEPMANDHSRNRIQTARDVMGSWGLRERYMKALREIPQVSKPKLREYLNQSISAAMKGEFEQYSEGFRERIVDRALSLLMPMNNRKNDVEGIVLVSRNRSMLFDAVTFSAESLLQSRDATLSGAAAAYKIAHRVKGKAHCIDLVSLVDPELCELVSGGKDQAASAVKKTPNTDNKDGYQDTGVVMGFAMKDIRGMGRDTLISKADQMNDLQKAKYLTKDLIWPRKGLDEMRENGIPLGVAVTFDLFWKALPNKPLSTSRSHVNTFVELMVGMRERVDPLVAHYHKHLDDHDDAFIEFSNSLASASEAAANDVGDLTSCYPYRARRIRGYGLDWRGCNPSFSSKLIRELSVMNWESLIKEKKRSEPSSGSRVQRNEVVREGPDYRKGADVTGDDFINTFMYSGVEYGNWTNQKERAKHLNFAYDSMMDFTRIMGWEPAVLSLGGRLGLCIGSRGRGGSRAAAAHFEPANMAVNLTRMRGDGSLAHEYFHAVAYHYGRIGNGKVSDVMDTLGYALRSPGAVPNPDLLANGLRDEVRHGFYNLIVAIMRKPAEGSDPKDIQSYTELSDMLKGSIKEESKGKLYWSTPSEMFARAMEVWFSDVLKHDGHRNDYLVGPNKAGAVYPDADHLERINHFAAPWLESLKTQVQQVDHPYLGKVAIPTLYSRHQSDQPLGRQDLIELAQTELSRLFGEVVPKVMVGPGTGWSGYYDLSANLIRLNEYSAGKDTFYHEAWHACHHKLLTQDERRGLDAVFAAGTAVSNKLVETMRAAGFGEDVIDEALANPQEMAAYAFQFWTKGEFSIEEREVSEFRRTKAFVDGVVEIGDLFGPDDAVRLFAKFAQGELSHRSNHEAAIKLGNDHSEDWDEDNKLFWQVPLSELPGLPEGGNKPNSSGLR